MAVMGTCRICCGTNGGHYSYCEKYGGAKPDDKKALAAARKMQPVGTGFCDYFPLAIKAVAHLSYVGNEQHNPGTPLHWDRSKSGDEADALMRHFLERGTVDTDGIRHSAKVAWRAMALLQKELELEARGLVPKKIACTCGQRLQHSNECAIVRASP